MMFKDVLKFNRQSFTAKIFYLFTVSILVIYFSFTVFFVYYHGKMMRNNFINEGRHLANILAYNLRIGVFTENTELLKGPLEGFMQYNEAVGVQVYSADGRELKSLVKSVGKSAEGLTETQPDVQKRAIDHLKKGGADYYYEYYNKFELWAPVVSGEAYSEDALFFRDDTSQKENRIIGFVRIVLTSEARQKHLRDVFLKGIVIPVLLLIPGWIIAFIIVKGITKPLKKLTDGVKSIGAGGEFQEVTVETKDEIGKLATAFNDMALSLKKREDEKQQLEEQLRHAQKMEAIGTFAGGIAHDFNNILTVIKSYGQLLMKKDLKADDAKRFLNSILSSAQKAATLTRSILAFGRKQSIDPHPVSLNQVIMGIKDVLLGLVDENIELNVQLADRDLIVVADKVQLENVLVNLVTNARDAMPEGGCLTMSVGSSELDDKHYIYSEPPRPGRYAVISVKDTGIGMDKHTKEKIFDPFFTTKKVGKGTGLGLSMAYGIIQQHGGYIDVKSEPGKGAAFEIYLPLSSEVIHEEELKDLPPLRGGTETVLVAEDDDDVRTLIATVLRRFGYDVIEAKDGKEAFEKFLYYKDNIDLLLLDITMPEKSGKEVYKEARMIKSDIRALFISGYSPDFTSGEPRIEEGVNLLSKPAMPDELARKVREVLDR